MGFRILNVIRLGHNFYRTRQALLKQTIFWSSKENWKTWLQWKKQKASIYSCRRSVGLFLQRKNIKLAEVLVTPQSEFLNNTLKSSNFRQKYGLVVLAINRSGHTLREAGKSYFACRRYIVGARTNRKIDYYKLSRDIAILDDFRPLLYKRRKGILTLAVFITSIILGSCNIFPLSASMILGVLVVVLIKAVSIERAYETIDWKLLVMIGGMSAFGTAMTNSGAATWLSQNIVNVMQPFGTLAIMAGFWFWQYFYTAHVQCRSSIGSIAYCDWNGETSWSKPKDICDCGYAERICFIGYTFRAIVYPGVWAGKYRFIDFSKREEYSLWYYWWRY